MKYPELNNTINLRPKTYWLYVPVPGHTVKPAIFKGHLIKKSHDRGASSQSGVDMPCIKRPAITVIYVYFLWDIEVSLMTGCTAMTFICRRYALRNKPHYQTPDHISTEIHRDTHIDI